MSTSLASSILNRFVRPDEPDLSPAVALYINSFKLSEDEQSRMNEPADKCTEGTLSADERREYESSVLLGELLTLMKAKALLVLQRHTAAA